MAYGLWHVAYDLLGNHVPMLHATAKKDMLTMNDLKLGLVVSFDNEPHEVQYCQHVQMGRGGAILRTKLKNLLSGNVLEKTFKSGDKIPEAELVKSRASFLYQEEDRFHFMDTITFEQFSLSKNQIGEIFPFLKEGGEVEIMNFESKPVAIILPPKVTLKVITAPPGVRGNTASGNITKLVTLETGYEVTVPLFIQEGNLIKINTQTGEYVERA